MLTLKLLECLLNFGVKSKQNLFCKVIRNFFYVKMSILFWQTKRKKEIKPLFFYNEVKQC